MSYETELESLKKYIDSVKILDPKPGRKIAKISSDDLVENLKAWVYNSNKDEFDDSDSVSLNDVAMYAKYTGKVKKDLEKIEFDNENAECENICQLDGYSVAHCWAGGDWEYPVHFFLYFDGSDIRGYIPENGNTFNYFCKSAFGSENGSRGSIKPLHSGIEKKIGNLFKNIGGYLNIPNFEDCDSMFGIVDEETAIRNFAINCESYRRGIDTNFSCVGEINTNAIHKSLDLMLNDFAKRVGIR